MIWTQVYSKSAEAGRKRVIDMMTIGFNLMDAASVDFHKEEYVKGLIGAATNGAVQVSKLSPKLQFFIIKGGAEGFLDKFYETVDASNLFIPGQLTTDGKPGTDMTFDDGCLMAVFDPRGKLIASALLRRPFTIKTASDPHFWTEHTANAIFDAWDKQPVSLYHNTNFDVAYFGLQINDSAGYYASGRARIDIHKQEATNGCIFIVDPATPPYPPEPANPNDPAQAAAHKAALTTLSHFEPDFIVKVQTAIGAKTKEGFGTMRVIKIK
jgi:hypothetical protein